MGAGQFRRGRAGQWDCHVLPDRRRQDPAPASRLQVKKTDKAVEIQTGRAGFGIPLDGDKLLSSAEVAGWHVLGKEGLRAVITSGAWPDRNLKAGARQVGVHDATGVTIEESGPARVVVAIKGQYKPGDKDGKFYGFITRLYFTHGSASVRVIHSITNGKLDPALEGGWRYIYTWPIQDASLVADLALGDKVTVSTPGETKLLTSDKELLVYQANDHEYKVTAGANELATGNGHPGVLSVQGEFAPVEIQLGLSAALRNFRVEHPHAIAGSARSLRIGLFPGEFGEPFPINGGQRKSWDIRLTFFGNGSRPGRPDGRRHRRHASVVPPRAGLDGADRSRRVLALRAGSGQGFDDG